MDRLDIINQVKPAAIEVMQDRNVLASILIAECVLISEKHKSILGNNPLRLTNMNNDSLLVFNTIEDCFNFFIDNGIIGQRDGIIRNHDYKSVVKFLRVGTENENTLIEIINAYKLNELDLEILDIIYDGRRTVVEIDTEPFIDFYRVRAAFGSDKTEVLTTTDKKLAIETCKKYYGYSVFNSKGQTVFSNALTTELKAKMKMQERVAPKPKMGNKIHLERVNLYESPDSKIPSRSVTGDYYISNNKRYNNRYMITNKPEYVGDTNYVLGYINASDKK